MLNLNNPIVKNTLFPDFDDDMVSINCMKCNSLNVVYKKKGFLFWKKTYRVCADCGCDTIVANVIYRPRK